MVDKLWVDKHRPQTLESLDFHEDLSLLLKNLAAHDDFPHLLFYGPNGAGKKTRVLAFLHEVYGAGVAKPQSELREFKVNTTTVECNVIYSKFHFDLTPSDAEFHDKSVVQGLIKEVASTHQLDPKVQKSFKVIVINEVDRLTREAQAALRRTMEKYMSKCRLILICENLGRVIPPLRSRCLLLRVPAPSNAVIENVLGKISKREKIILPQNIASNLVEKSERNLRRAILQLQTCKMQAYPFKEKQELHSPEWVLAINDIKKDIFLEQTPKKLREIRDKLYELLINCIPGEIIVKYLLKECLTAVDSEVKHQYIHWAAFHENKMQLGNKPIFHLEALIARFMVILRKYNLEQK